MNPLKIEMSIDIARPVADVFAAWSTVKGMTSWFAPMAVSSPTVSMDFRENGKYSIEMPLEGGVVFTTSGVYKEILPQRKIVMTWRCDAFPDPESLVTVHFDSNTAGTVIRLIHERFANEDTCANHRGGWELCLAELKNVLSS